VRQKYKRKKTDLSEAKNYADLKKSAEDRSIWRTTIKISPLQDISD